MLISYSHLDAGFAWGISGACLVACLLLESVHFARVAWVTSCSRNLKTLVGLAESVDAQESGFINLSLHPERCCMPTKSTALQFAVPFDI